MIMNKQQIIDNEEAKLKELILGTVGNLVSELMYYGRKEDEDLPNGVIEESVHQGLITQEEIVNKFKENLSNCFE